MLDVLMVSSEVAPFAKTGGLADVAGALPKALAENEINVRIFMPLYKNIKEKFELTNKETISFHFGGKKEEAAIWKGFLPRSDVPVFFLDKPSYYERSGLYQENGADYPDNAERFAFFSLAALEWCKHTNFFPQVIHCHDWQAALLPVYLKTCYGDNLSFKNTATVLTIHNIAYQGAFPKETLAKINLPDSLYSVNALEFWNQISYLKGGIVFADQINTVSPTYAKEISSSQEFGRGLEGVLEARSSDLSGIINGIDYDEWNPANDPFLTLKYNARSLKNKKEIKKALLEEAGLGETSIVPLVGLISRLDDQKGWDLVAKAIPELFKTGIKFIILGTGDPKYHEILNNIKKEFPFQVAAFLKFDNELAHKIYAGSDFFLMPSRYEPCGLGQLISLKYGTIPIVRETGGLADTIKDIDTNENGNGFSFSDYSASALITTVKRGLEWYKESSKWKSFISRVMKENWSWDTSSKEYIRLYKQAGKKLSKELPKEHSKTHYISTT